MQNRSNLTYFFALAVVVMACLPGQSAGAKPNISSLLKKSLSTIPGVKPKYVEPLDIEKYLKDGEKKPRWENSEIPIILSQSDVSRYRVIFRLQEEGDWHIADRIIYSLENPILMGHVLARRYLHPNKYRTSYRELKAWLEKYWDHPEARQMYKLALKRRPANWKLPRKPQIRTAKFIGNHNHPKGHKKYSRIKKLSNVDRLEMLGYERRLRYYLRKGWTLAFKKLIKRTRVKNLFHPWQ